MDRDRLWSLVRQSRTRLSSVPEATYRPSGDAATDQTAAPEPANTASSLNAGTRQSFTRRSPPPPLTRYLPSPENARDRMTELVGREGSRERAVGERHDLDLTIVAAAHGEPSSFRTDRQRVRRRRLRAHSSRTPGTSHSFTPALAS